MDGRRHSVDIPISKTLTALRRVRSLRDPSTNSLSKLSAFVDNLNWETNSTNGIVLENVNNCLDENDTLGLNNLGLFGHSRNQVIDCEIYYGQSKHKPGSLQANQAVVFENKSLSERYCDYYKDLTCKTPTSDYTEGEGSCKESRDALMEAKKLNHNGYKRKCRRRKHIRSSNVTGCDKMSCASSPCLSIGETPFGGSSCGTPLHENADVSLQDADHHGCGIGYCWLMTPKFRGSNSYNKEEQPLLTTEVGVSKHYSNEITPYSESPRSLSQKFRPKSFDELVGQNVISKSLLGAIKGRSFTSFYLFHGPRGTGKTSAARIFAAALNCLSIEEKKPCGQCQECALFFAGRSRDVKEVDSVSMNCSENLRYLIKNAMLPPVSSNFKVFIIDECQLIRESAWATLLNSLDEVSQHIIFIMITPDLSKLPWSTVPRSQRFRFSKIKEADIVERLEKICLEEGFNYDQNALDFIAAKSNGSIRDAEMTLEQLSLLGKRITMSLAYELIGIVSDDELLELLAMALSSDTSNTVKRARELMTSRIDPMQLISQLANLIMDILAGKFQEGASEVKRQFFKRHTSEADLQQLNNALKILSETEKQLRTSKNQTTWLTVALLQLSSAGSSFNANDSSLCLRTIHPRDGSDHCSTSSPSESLQNIVPCQCGHKKGCKSERVNDKVTLESIWSRATEICKSISLRNFLRKNGKLASVCFHEGLAVVELEFQHPDYVSKAEKSWKLIASALQAALGRNVEISIYNSDKGSRRNYAKFKKPSFSLFGCSRRIQKSTTPHENNLSDNINITLEQMKVKDNGGSHLSHKCFHGKEEPVKTIRNSDGNALSVDILGQDPPKKSSCCPRSVKLHKKFRSSDNSQITSVTSERDENLVLSVPGITSSETCFCTGDPYVICNFWKNHTTCHGVERQKKDSKVHCWRTPTFPLKKAWQLQPQRAHLMDWVLPCAKAK